MTAAAWKLLKPPVLEDLTVDSSNRPAITDSETVLDSGSLDMMKQTSFLAQSEPESVSAAALKS